MDEKELLNQLDMIKRRLDYLMENVEEIQVQWQEQFNEMNKRFEILEFSVHRREKKGSIHV